MVSVKKIFIILFLLSLMSRAVLAQDKQADSLGRVILRSFSEQNFALLQSTLLPDKLWSYYWDGWDTLSLRAKKVLIQGSKEELKKHFDKIVDIAAEGKIALDKLVYDGVTSKDHPEFSNNDGAELVSLDVYYLYNGKRGNFYMGGLRINGKLYITDILVVTR
jgi:hypothetical protein